MCVYEGIRFTPTDIVKAARDKNVHVVGLSILSGSHMPLVKEVVTKMREAGLDDVPVVVGGIIPPDDEATLKDAGVAAVYTPKDFEAPLRASALHHSSCVTLRLRFNLPQPGVSIIRAAPHRHLVC